jgi:hypothetical protein
MVALADEARAWAPDLEPAAAQVQVTHQQIAGLVRAQPRERHRLIEHRANVATVRLIDPFRSPRRPRPTAIP